MPLKIISVTQVTTAFLMLLYEFQQIRRNVYKYFKTTTNYIDLFAIFFYLVSSVIFEKFNFSKLWMSSLYSIGIIAGFMKLNRNLEALDNFRHLSYALFKIFVDLKIYLFLGGLFIVFFSMIFYNSEFLDNDLIKGHELRYYEYMLSTYEYVFGNWAYVDPNDLDMKSIILLHIVFSFVFGVVFVNILIAIVSDSFSNIQMEKRSVSTYLKLELIRDGIDIVMTINNIKDFLKNWRLGKSFKNSFIEASRYRKNKEDCFLYLIDDIDHEQDLPDNANI